MGVKLSRTFPAPDAVGGGAYTTDELEVLSHSETALGLWAGRTYRRERDGLLASLSDDTKLPQGVTERDEYGFDRVIALEYEDAWLTPEGWVEPMVAAGFMELNADDVAFVARAFHEGINHVYFRPGVPGAFFDGAPEGLVATAGMGTGLNEGAVVAAIVDELDKNAVLELIAVSPGPIVQRRHDGEWREDPMWLHALRSVKPPLLVKIADETLLGSIITQIDNATEGLPFSKDDDNEELEVADDAEDDEGLEASALVASIEAADLLAGVELALVAASVNKVKGAAGAERLRQYWLHGKGAAKIRWGSPSDWTRCYKYLSKYLGPRAKSYCALMHARATGTWAGKNHKTTPNPAVTAKAIAKQMGH